MIKIIKILFTLLCISLFYSSEASQTTDVNDCEVIVKISETNTYFDVYSEWYYELSWETVWSASTPGWTKISVEKLLSNDNFCETSYALSSNHFVYFEDNYKIWDLLRWGINASGDEFSYTTFMNNVIIENNWSILWDPIIIKKYKVIYMDKLRNYLPHISNEKFERALKDIDILLLKHSDKDLVADNDIIISQLIALKEIIEDNYDAWN